MMTIVRSSSIGYCLPVVACAVLICTFSTVNGKKISGECSTSNENHPELFVLFDSANITVNNNISIELSQSNPVACDMTDTHQCMIFNFEDVILLFNFTKTKATYKLKQMKLLVKQYNIDSFVNELDLGETKKFNFTQGYLCEDISIDFGKVNLKLKEFKFAAFQQNFTIENFHPIVCNFKETNPGNSLVPIVVGSCLLGFMAVSLVIYIYMRNKSG